MYDVISLSNDNVVSNPNLKLERLFDYYRLSNKSQSTMYRDNVYSLKYTIAEYINTGDLEDKIEMELTEYLSKYFETVDMKARIDKDDFGRPILYISGKTVENGVYSYLDRVVEMDEN